MAAHIGFDRSGRVKCKKCGHRIEINTLRIGWYRIERLRANWCHIECFANVQCEKRPFVFHNLIRYGFKVENLIGFFDLNRSDKIYVYQLFKKYWKEIGKLRLKKPIYLMNRYELWIELRKRHLSIIGETNRLQQRLMHFYRFEIHKIRKYHEKFDEKLFFGYSRNIEKDYKLNIPKHIKKVGMRYFETYPVFRS